MSCGKNASSAGSIIPEKECPQAGQTNVYASNPQLSITGSSDLRNGTAAEQLGHSATPALPENGNFETFSTRDKSSWSSEVSPSVTARLTAPLAGVAGQRLTTPRCCSPATCTTQQGPLIRPALFFDRLGDIASPDWKMVQTAGALTTGDRG